MASYLLLRGFAALLEQSSKHDIPLTTQEALSGIAGSMSLVAWMFLLIPQVVENYKNQSADGVSLLFILVWFAGDVTNLAGAAWAKLVPTVIALAVYFCFLDVVLVSQCMYYRLKNRDVNRTLSTATANTEGTEEEPLLSRRDSNNSFGLPGSHKRRRSSAASRRTASFDEPAANGHVLPKINEEDASQDGRGTAMEWVKNAACILLACALGAAGWAICWKLGVWKPSPLPGEHSGDGGAGDTKKSTPAGAEILGYISAVLYLGARIPQIIKNYKDQSCEGLSLLFFMLSLMGNLTYGAGILIHSLEKQYIITNLPWLIGSLGTIVQDTTIFVQFRIYGDGDAKDETAVEAVE